MLFTRKSVLIAVAITAVLILYFLLIDFLGAVDHFYLSFLNAAIMMLGLYFVIRQTHKDFGTQFTYMKGYLTSLATGILSSILFTVFMSFYMFDINPEIATMLNKSLLLASGTTRGPLLLFVLLSGISTAIVSSLIVIPIFKPSWNIKQSSRKQEVIENYTS